MVRFKVVRASKLLLVAAIVALAAALALVGARLLRQRPAPTVSGSANLVDAASSDEAKTALVFASSGVAASSPADRYISSSCAFVALVFAERIP